MALTAGTPDRGWNVAAVVEDGHRLRGAVVYVDGVVEGTGAS